MREEEVEEEEEEQRMPAVVVVLLVAARMPRVLLRTKNAVSARKASDVFTVDLLGW